MAPLVVVAIVATSLFGTGTLIKEKNPTVGTVLQGAGIGTLVGGGIGAAAGATGGVATALGTSTVGATVAGSAVVGGGVGGVGSYFFK